MGRRFSYGFLGLSLLCLLLFLGAEVWPLYRQPLAALAAVVEGMVFIMLGFVLWRVRWGGGDGGLGGK
ncbi:MAG: hypothetical protein EBQ80_04390 [Proteobacteria bacterium]|nr:hypothetical protein [Pseudomonadota bacterium]